MSARQSTGHSGHSAVAENSKTNLLTCFEKKRLTPPFSAFVKGSYYPDDLTQVVDDLSIDIISFVRRGLKLATSRVCNTRAPMTTQVIRKDKPQPTEQPKPEWIRTEEAIRLFGIPKTTLQRMVKEGRIESTCLTREGKSRGIRLISYSSIVSLITASKKNGGAK